MGADLSSCCSVEPANKNEKEKTERSNSVTAQQPSKPAPVATNTQQPAPKATATETPPPPSTQPSPPAQTPHPPPPPKQVSPPPSEADVKEFQSRLEQSMEVVVLLADATELTCQLKYSIDDNSISISCDKNVRVIPLHELKAILSGRDQLKRVETKANLIDDKNCVALHMSTGNCIPMRFAEFKDKQSFISLITPKIKESK